MKKIPVILLTAAISVICLDGDIDNRRREHIMADKACRSQCEPTGSRNDRHPSLHDKPFFKLIVEVDGHPEMNSEYHMAIK